MKSILFFLAILSALVTNDLCGQTTYILTPKGEIVDTSTYNQMIADRIRQTKDLFPGENAKVKIIDNLKVIRHTVDSIIYTYTWDIHTDLSDLKNQRSPFEAKDYLGKPFIFPTIMTIDNKKINFDDLLGKPTIINFWFTACKPCIEEMPILSGLKDKFQDSINFISVNYESTKKVLKFLKKHHYNFTHIADAKKYTDHMNMSAFPINIFLDKDGIVRKVDYGIPYIKGEDDEFVMSDGQEFEIFLRDLLAYDE